MTFCACETRWRRRSSDAVMYCGALSFRPCRHARLSRSRCCAPGRRIRRPRQFVADFAFRELRWADLHGRLARRRAARTLMLDTGNAHSTLITDVARELNWTLARRRNATGTTVPGIWLAASIASPWRRRGAGDVLRVRARAAWRLPAAGRRLALVRLLQGSRASDRLSASPDLRVTNADRDASAGRKARRRRHASPDHVRRARAAGRVGSPFTVNGKTVHAQIDTVFHGHDADLRQRARYTGSGRKAPRSSSVHRRRRQSARRALGRVGFGGRGLVGGARTLYFVGEGKNPVHQPDGMFEATVGNALFAHSSSRSISTR